jgi:hypothetical protein
MAYHERAVLRVNTGARHSMNEDLHELDYIYEHTVRHDGCLAGSSILFRI